MRPQYMAEIAGHGHYASATPLEGERFSVAAAARALSRCRQPRWGRVATGSAFACWWLRKTVPRQRQKPPPSPARCRGDSDKTRAARRRPQEACGWPMITRDECLDYAAECEHMARSEKDPDIRQR